MNTINLSDLRNQKPEYSALSDDEFINRFRVKNPDWEVIRDGDKQEKKGIKIPFITPAFRAGQEFGRKGREFEKELRADPIKSLTDLVYGLSKTLVPEHIQRNIIESAQKTGQPLPVEDSQSQAFGEFLPKQIASTLLYQKIAPTATGAKKVGKVLLSNLPFVEKELKEKQLKEAGLATGINVLIDLLQQKQIGIPKTTKIPKIIKESIDIPIEGEKITLKATQAPQKTFREKMPLIGTRLSETERSVLSEPLEKKDLPFTDFAKIQRAVQSNPRNPTPFDFVGSLGKRTLDKIVDARQKIGKQMDKIVEPNQDKLVNISAEQNLWKAELQKRMGAGIDAEGNVIPLRGSVISYPSEIPLIKQANEIMSSVGDISTIGELIRVKRALRDTYLNPPVSQTRQKLSVSEGIISEIVKRIDIKSKRVLGSNFRKANEKYGQYKNMEDLLNRGLGRVADIESEMTQRGASLMKSAVQSNADRGTKALFEQIRKEFGIDLFKQAKYAEMAMKASGDPRALSLLESSGIISGELPMPSSLGLGIKGLTGLIKKGRGDVLDEMIDFFNKQHKFYSIGKGTKQVRGKTLNQTLLEKGINQRGVLSLPGSKLIPAIKSPSTNKIYTGNQHKQILNSKIIKMEPNIEKTVWEELFKDNIGQYSPFIGFVDEHGTFISRLDAEKQLEKRTFGTLAQQFHYAFPSLLALQKLKEKKENK